MSAIKVILKNDNGIQILPLTTIDQVVINTETNETLEENITLINETISQLGTAANKDVGLSQGNLVELASNGKLPDSVIPNNLITNYYEVSSENDMLALEANKGDIVNRTDINKTFILSSNPASVLENWKAFLSINLVTSVNGQTGNVQIDSLKNPHKLNIKHNGNSLGNYDGSEETTIEINSITEYDIQTIVNNSISTNPDGTKVGYILPQANGTILGGVKARPTTEDPEATGEVFIDTDTGFLFSKGGGGGAGTVDYETSGEVDGEIISGGIGNYLPVGAIFMSAVKLNDATVHILDGALFNQDGIYSEFATWLNEEANKGNVPTCTNDEYEEMIELYGQCGKFVIDNEYKTFRIPTITKFVEGLSDITKIGENIAAGLPNITGNFNSFNPDYTGGAFYIASTGNNIAGGNVGTTGANFDASRSSPVYGNSETVQPESIQYPYYIVLATSVKTNIQINTDKIVNELEKLQPYLIESWISSDENSWYRIYSDGWKECGGKFVSADATDTEVKLPITFSNTNYFPIVGMMLGTSGGTTYRVFSINSITINSINIHNATNGSGNICIWECKGY